MNDNLATMNRLVLLVENAKSPILNARSASPSLASLQAAEALNRPILRLLEPNDPPLIESTARVTATIQTQSAADWPCELGMDALKLGRHSATSVRARLARRSYDSRFPAPAGCNSLQQGHLVDTTPLFSGTPAATGGVTALTMGGAVDPAAKPGSKTVYLPEMEWATVEWEWPDRPHSAPAGCGGSVAAPQVRSPAAQGPSALPLSEAPTSGSTECGACLTCPASCACQYHQRTVRSSVSDIKARGSWLCCLAEFEDGIDWSVPPLCLAQPPPHRIARLLIPMPCPC